MLDSKDFISADCYVSKYDENRNIYFIKDRKNPTLLRKDDIMAIDYFVGFVKDEASGDLNETDMVKVYMSSSFSFYAKDEGQFNTCDYGMMYKFCKLIGIK